MASVENNSNYRFLNATEAGSLWLVKFNGLILQSMAHTNHKFPLSQARRLVHTVGVKLKFPVQFP